MKKTVPRQNADEATTKSQCAHVRDMPILTGKPALADFDQLRRRVRAGDRPALFDQISADRLARAASPGPTREAIILGPNKLYTLNARKTLWSIVLPARSIRRKSRLFESLPNSNSSISTVGRNASLIAYRAGVEASPTRIERRQIALMIRNSVVFPEQYGPTTQICGATANR